MALHGLVGVMLLRVLVRNLLAERNIVDLVIIASHQIVLDQSVHLLLSESEIQVLQTYEQVFGGDGPCVFEVELSKGAEYSKLLLRCTQSLSFS